MPRNWLRTVSSLLQSTRHARSYISQLISYLLYSFPHEMQLLVVLPIMLIALATLAARVNGQQSKLLSRVSHQNNTAARGDLIASLHILAKA